jgi:3-deoxy-D-manno-octulosonic-acid transferase
VRPLSLAAYAVTARCLAPALQLMLRRRVAAGKELLLRLPERSGRDPTPRPPGKLLWMHAASVGETVSILPVLSALDPAITVLLTTGTVTSAALLGQRLPALGLEGSVLHRFVPLDVPGWAARFLDHWRPDAAAFVESELWPNLLAACGRRGIRLALINARMSERSLSRWRLLPGTACAVLGAFHRVQAQSESDAERLRALGARAVTAPGNLKFAAPPLPADPEELARLRGLIGDRPVWLAASTHPGEETLIAAVHGAVTSAHPGLLTIIAPRHPQRGEKIAAELGGVPRRSAGQDPPAGGFWVADTMGELGLLYRLAGKSFVGRSLAGRGGQNPLEPARLGCAVAIGPHTANFADPVAVLMEAGALCVVPDQEALATWLRAMLANPAWREAAGAAGETACQRYASLPVQTAAMLAAMVG